MSTQSDKLAAQHRKCLAMADITPQLRLFAVLCAESALPIFETRYPKDKRPRECIEVTRRYLDGKANIDELRSACAAAYAADAACAARKQARERQEKTLISLLPEAFNAWKV